MIEQFLAREAAESKVTTLKKELHTLAVECNKAFQVAGLHKNSHPQIAKALELCSSHTTTTPTPQSEGISHGKASSRIADLWRNEIPVQDTGDEKTLATSILGAKLVETLNEDNHQQPDVRECVFGIIIIQCRHFRSIPKSVGNFPALSSVGKCSALSKCRKLSGILKCRKFFGTFKCRKVFGTFKV